MDKGAFPRDETISIQQDELRQNSSTRLEEAFRLMLQEEAYRNLLWPRDIKQFGYHQFSRVSNSTLADDSTGQSAQSSPRTVNPSFSLVPGDVLQISTFGNSDLSMEGVVDAKGRIFLPKIGVVHVSGLPFLKAEAVIQKKVTKLYVGSEVYVQLLSQSERTISVFGKVTRPGTRSLSGMGTIMDALAEAGGVLPTGSLRNIRITHGGHTRTVDLYGALTGNGDGIHLRGGEVIHVPPIGPTVALVGEVLEPGIYEILPNEPLRKFLEMVAHPTPLANPRKVNIHRADSVAHKTNVLSEHRQNSESHLNVFDVISIPGRVHELGRLVSISGAVKSPGSYQFDPGQSLSDLIKAAGGLTRYHGSLAHIKRILKKPLYRNTQGGQLTRIDHRAIDVPLKASSLEQTVLQSGDDVSIDFREPDLVSAKVTLLGEVTHPGIYPFMEGMSLHQLLSQAGGILEEANLDGVTISRSDKEGSIEVFLKQETHLGLLVELKGISLQEGDVVTVPTQSKNGIFVESQGEFLRPGTYQLPKGARISDLILTSGGMAEGAFVYGAGFFRKSVAKTFNEKMAELADQLEENLLRSHKSSIESSLQSQSQKNEAIFIKQERLVRRLRESKSPGRVAMNLIGDLEAFKSSPHNLILEDGDRLFIPSTPSTVNVLGQVYNPNTLAWQPDFSPSDYLSASGGVTPSADEKKIYILKANGSVVPFSQLGKRGSFSWITGRRASTANIGAIGPGDSILVPENFDIRQNKLQITKDISQIMFQIIGALGVVVAAF